MDQNNFDILAQRVGALVLENCMLIAQLQDLQQGVNTEALVKQNREQAGRIKELEDTLAQLRDEEAKKDGR